MKKLFLSDFHLGSPLFNKEEDLISLITSSEYKNIYILGDIFDTWENNIWSIANKYRHLLEILNANGDRIVVIKGNHDPNLSILQELLPECKVVEGNHFEIIDTKSMIMAHGNEFDPDYWWTKFFFPVHWLLERFGLNVKYWIRKIIYKRQAKKLGVSLDDIVVEPERKLVEKYKYQCDIFICGHSHEPKVVHLDNLLFVNVGTLLYYPVYYEYDNGEFIKKEI